MEWLILGPLAVVGGLLALLLALALALLCLPFHLRADGALGPAGVRADVEARWAWGVVAFRAALGEGAAVRLVGVRVPIRPRRPDAEGVDAGDADDQGDEDRRRSARGEAKRGRQGPKRGPRWAWQNRRSLAGMAGRLWRTLGLRVRVEGVVGLGDPADTAALWAALVGLERLGGRVGPALELALEPDWLEEALDLRGQVRARLWLAHVLAVGVGLLLRAEDRRVLLGGGPPGARSSNS